MLPLDQNQLVDQGTLTAVTVVAAGTVGVCWGLVWRGKTWYFSSLAALVVVSAYSVWRPIGFIWLAILAIAYGYLTTKFERWSVDWSVDSEMRWLFVASAFAVFIGGLSNSSGSPGHLHEQIAAWLHISPEQAWHLVVGVRKTIHFSAYGLATLAAYRWSTANGAPGLWRGIAFTLPLACFDEFRQHFATGREGSPWDVALDMAGAATFLFIAWLIDRRYRAPAAA